MITVRVELNSAKTKTTTEIARMRIVNDGTGSPGLGDYRVSTFRGRSAIMLNRHIVNRRGTIQNWPRLRRHVWMLVGESLAAMGYMERSK